MRRRIPLARTALWLALWFAALPAPAWAGYIQLDGVADVKTRYSSGCSSVQDIAETAEGSGIDVVIYNDRARDSLQYGVFPLRRILKKTDVRRSVLNTNATFYLSDIKNKNEQFPKTLLIPGVDVSPFYYWSGSAIKKTLVAHNWDKRLSIIGLETGASLEQLPLLNSNFSKNYTAHFQNSTIGLCFLFFIALALAIKGYHRKYVYPVMGFLVLLMINYHPFRSSPFDQYSGDPGIGPYQEVIDYATSQGALVFWNDVEAAGGNRERGSVKLETRPHPEDLVLSRNYTGFQAVGEKPVAITEPGNIWDHVLMQYLRGERPHAAWGYGASDYQCNGETGPVFGAVRTVFLVRENKKEAVMDALKNGRMYAVRQPGMNRLSLDEFLVRDKASGREATLGEELVSIDDPEISLKIRSTGEAGQRARIFLIRNGKLIKRESVTLPYELTWTDSKVDMSEPVYYRVNAKVSEVDHLVSNPVFVRFGKIPPQVAAQPGKPEPGTGGRAPERPSLTRPETPKAPAATTPPAPKSAPPETPPEVAAAPAKQAQTPKAPPTPKTPAVETARPPAKPPAPIVTASSGKTVRARIDGVALKKGPGAVFPVWKKVNKEDALKLVRRTSVLFQDKVWLVVEYEGEKAYVWEGLVTVEP